MKQNLLLGLLIRLNGLCRKYLYQSPAVARIIFSCNLSSYHGISFFELCTLIMRRALARYLKSGMRVLEVGAGPYAVLLLWACKRWALDITAVEIDGQSVESANICTKKNGVQVTILESDLFKNVQGTFDLIWFVPPFIPEHIFIWQLKMFGIADAGDIERLRKRTCGGENGWEIINRYYREAMPLLNEKGMILSVVNLAYHSDQAWSGIIKKQGYRIVDTVGVPFLSYRVYVACRESRP